ncbi:MAG: bifunctional diguanylate cyclase/phosphodiesterase [Synechococcaceae cyanobacterium]|nr:bifunctional diguanylate cyclase/phosphodiesterase [Synechococcaceae cyanobacterium]
MSETPWSLLVLSEVLSAFRVDDPQALGRVVNRVAESVDAEVAAVIEAATIQYSIGLREPDRQALLQLATERLALQQLPAGTLHLYWAPIEAEAVLVVGRLAEPFNLEERSLLRAMGRSVELCTQVLRALAAERLARQAALEQARHDPLTGLPNRLLVLQRLEELMQESRQGLAPCPPAVLFIDVDRFKLINDAHGHAVGDHYLMAIANDLRQVVRSVDLVGRLSGDEFVVVMRASEEREASALAQRILRQVGMPRPMAGRLLGHGLSIGICCGSHADTAERLIENADLAMYQAKQKGRGRQAIYCSGLRQQVRQRAAIEADLRRALDSDQISCAYQPIISLSQRRIVGFEALARWQHPQQGQIPPETFIAVAEDSGLIMAIDHWIIGQACADIAAWAARQPIPPLQLCLNVSARTFLAAGLVDRLRETLLRTGLLAKNLRIEITESLLMEDLDQTTEVVHQLSELGIRLAIDDFGTGYSSLRYLKRFPVGILKIDRSFIAGLGKDPEDAVIVRAVISMTQALGIDVVAEGVEHHGQLRLLARLGCDLLQGYLFGRPCEAKAAEALLQTPLPLPVLDRAGDVVVSG